MNIFLLFFYKDSGVFQEKNNSKVRILSLFLAVFSVNFWHILQAFLILISEICRYTLFYNGKSNVFFSLSAKAIFSIFEQKGSIKMSIWMDFWTKVTKRKFIDWIHWLKTEFIKFRFLRTILISHHVNNSLCSSENYGELIVPFG